MFSRTSRAKEPTRPIDYSDLEKQLGHGAKLGMYFYLLDGDGRVIATESYESDRTLPMASTKKTTIALLVFKKILVEKQFSLSEQITFDECDFVPGPPTNPLDQYFFNLSEQYPTQTKTIEELLILMLTKSDNTASDKLLNLVGGPVAVNELMSELSISGYNITRTSRQLLGDYYGVTPTKSKGNCELMLHELTSEIYVKHNSENILFASGEDSCTPAAMSRLIRLLYSSSTRNDNVWLSIAAKHICDVMKLCQTGGNRIKKGVANFSDIECIGNKTGGLGGIANDTAFIQFKDNQCGILTIYTAFSSLALEEREDLISRVTSLVVGHYRPLEPDKQPGFVSIF